MPRRYFNWKLAIVLIIGIVVLGATAFVLRKWQRANRAERGLTLGNKAYDEQKWEEAALNLGRYISVEQNDVPALIKYADAQLKRRPSKRGNIQQAIAAYRAVLRADKNNSEAALRLTEVYLMIGMPGEAELIANRQLDINDDPGLRRMLAMALARQRKFSEAATELRAILQEHPDQIVAYETLGQLTEQRPEDFQGSPAHLYDEAITNNPSSALAYLVRAGFYRRSKNNAKALADLIQAAKQDLSDHAVRLRLAKELINVNELDKAEEHLAIVQESMPSHQDLWQTWGQLALVSQSQEKMLRVAETGLKELSSQPWDFMPAATELFIRSGKLDRADKCISEMKQKDIAPIAVAFLEGLVAAERGDLFKAVEYWKQSVELGNTSSQVKLTIASALFRLGNTQSALQYLRSLISEKPNLFGGHLTLAKLLAGIGSWAEAAEHAATAMRLSPENLEPALLYLQAKIQLQAAGSTGDNTQIWQDIEKQLSELEEKTNGALNVRLLQFQLALKRGHFTDAQALITQLEKSHPSEVKVAMAEAELFAVQNKIDETISLLNKTIEEFPDSVEPVRYFAILLAREGNREKCEAVIEDALGRIERPVTQRELGLLLARFYTQWDQKDKAYPILNTLARKMPNDVPIKRRLLVCEQVIKDSEKAQQLVDDIKSIEGEDGWQWRYEQARIWFASDDFKALYPQIVSLLQENLQANPSDQASRILLASAYDRSGEVQLALSTYREGISRSPDDLRIIIPAVNALYRAKEYDEADQLLSRVRASRPQFFDSQLQQLQLQSHLRRGELNLASDILQGFIRDDPNNQSARFSLAILKTQQSEFDEAEELLDGLKAQDPDSLPITYAQVQLNLRQDKAQEALQLCDELVGKLNSASAYILRARTHTTLKRIDKAIEDFEQATVIEPNNVEVWIARSELYRSIGKPNEAIADIEHALSVAPEDVQIQIQKRAIPLLLASGDADKINQGKAMLDEALRLNPEDIQLRLYKVNSLLTEGTAPAIENATSILQKITEDQPGVSQAWAFLGEISLRQQQHAKALDIALRGLAHTPNDRNLLFLKARAEADRSPALAIPTLTVLRELDPNDTEIIVFMANTYVAAGKPQKAIDLLKMQLEYNVDSSDERRMNIAFARALYKNGNKGEAQDIFDSLLQAEPNNPGPLLVQLQLLKDDQLWSEFGLRAVDWCQKYPENSLVPISIARDLMTIESNEAKKIAEDILRFLLKNDSESVEVLTTLAVLLHTDDRVDESIQMYQRVLEIQPDNVVTMNNLAWILCEEQGKFQQALELTRKGLQISPNYVDLIDTRGVIHYRMGELNKAVEDFTLCIKLYPENDPAVIGSRFHLARAFAALGQKDKAIEYLTQALDTSGRIQVGGLTTKDLAEAQRLLKQLQEGN
jgi:tetratricopeptide (TPR) repeat protein